MSNTCVAADGKTPVINVGPGQPLMVRAVDFNAVVGQRDLLLERLQRLTNYLDLSANCNTDKAVAASANKLIAEIKESTT